MNKKKGDTLLYIQEPKKEGEEGRENHLTFCVTIFQNQPFLATIIQLHLHFFLETLPAKNCFPSNQ